MAAPHWMKWYKPVVDCAAYETGLLNMMQQIEARPVFFGIEVGLGWGVSGSMFLRNFPEAALISVDVESELQAVGHLQSLHPHRFHFCDNPALFDHGGIKPIFDCVWLYIDAGHTYEEVKADLRRYEGLLKPGGVIAFDDYGTDPKDQWHYPGVKQAVDEFMAANPGRYTPLQIVHQSPTKPAWAMRLP